MRIENGEAATNNNFHDETRANNEFLQKVKRHKTVNVPMSARIEGRRTQKASGSDVTEVFQE